VVAAVLRCGSVICLRLLEVRKDLRISPPVVAKPRPSVEVSTISPDVYHRVDRTAAAENLTSGNVDGTPTQPRLRHGGVAPVLCTLGIPQAVHRVQARGIYGRIGVHATQLEQRNTALRVHAQPGGQDTAGRPRSHHYVIDVGVGHRRLLVMLCNPCVAFGMPHRSACGSQVMRKRWTSRKPGMTDSLSRPITASTGMSGLCSTRLSACDIWNFHDTTAGRSTVKAVSTHPSTRCHTSSGPVISTEPRKLGPATSIM